MVFFDEMPSKILFFLPPEPSKMDNTIHFLNFHPSILL